MALLVGFGGLSDERGLLGSIKYESSAFFPEREASPDAKPTVSGRQVLEGVSCGAREELREGPGC